MPIADGLAADVDLSYLLDYGGVFEPLRDPAYFRQLRAHPEAGTIVWPNEADIAPETLYAHARLCDCIGVVVPNTAAKWS